MGSVKEANKLQEEGATNDYEDIPNHSSALTDRDANVKALQDDNNNVH